MDKGKVEETGHRGSSRTAGSGSGGSKGLDGTSGVGGTCGVAGGAGAGAGAPTLPPAARISPTSIDFTNASAPVKISTGDSSEKLKKQQQQTDPEIGSGRSAKHPNPSSAPSPLISPQKDSSDPLASAVPSTCGSRTSTISPIRGRFLDEPLTTVEESEDGTRTVTGRSGSAGTLPERPVTGTSGGIQPKRASLHHGHGKKLIRRSSFLVDTACSHGGSHIAVFAKPVVEPVPQPVVQQTRRCSLTLPYPHLYGSWQAAAVSPVMIPLAIKTDFPMVGSSTEHPRHPPLLKRRSVAQFDMTTTSSPAEMMANFRRVRPPPTTTSASLASPSTGHLEPSPEEEPTALVSCHLALASSSGTPALKDTGVILVDAAGTAIDTTTTTVVDVETGEEVQLVDEPYLLAIHLQKVPLKDFGSEVRATLDVAHFLNQAVLLLDINESSLEAVVDAILVRLFRVVEEPHCSFAEVKSSLFAHDSVHLLARTIQGTIGSEGISFDYDPTWICAICNLPSLQKRHVAIARLKHAANFGRTSQEIRLFILVLCPSKEKGTKNALETGRTFATIFSEEEFRQNLLEAHTEYEFKRLILKQAQDLSQQQSNLDARLLDSEAPGPDYIYQQEKFFQFGRGIKEDFFRRLPHYISDYTDGIVGYKTIQKTISTTFFLYFACILPAIAFGVLNDHTTQGLIDVKKVIVGQTLGELFYVVLSGQPLNILLTTAPLCLFVKIVYALAEDFEVDFEALYCCVGLWSSLFTGLYAFLDVSRIMKWSTRSTEEIFALFISIAFCVDAFRDTVKNFKDNYSSPSCSNATNSTDKAGGLSSLLIPGNTTPDSSDYYSGGGSSSMSMSSSSWLRGTLNGTMSAVNSSVAETAACHRDSSILFLLLMLGTLWLGVSLYNFNKTPYLQASKREALADYSLPVAVLFLSFIGSFVFQDVVLERFKYDDNAVFKVAAIHKISWTAMFCSIGLGFSLSLLIFMDQNITSAMVNNPCNKLKKGPAYHWDLMIVAIINGFLSIFTMPWMHATLPHSPLHMRSLADVEERVDQGHVYEIIVRVRETRLTGIFSHVLIGLSIFLLPYPLENIPIAVLDGLFLYMAVTALNGNQMFERITLLFMEQAAYPPNHYIRRVPQRKIHQFTGCQVLQLSVMCVVGFVPVAYVKMVFPVTLFLLLPVRHKLVPLIIEQKYLDALDGEHQ